MTAKRQRLDEKQTRARIKELHAQGLSRNAIAANMGISASSVTKYARGVVSFDRSQTSQAVAAAAMDLAARRTRLAERMMIVAEGALDAVEATSVEVVQITQNGKIVRTTRSTDQTDRRNALTTAGIAFDKVTKLLDKDTNVDAAGSILDGLWAGITAAAAGLSSPTSTTTTETGGDDHADD